MECSESMKNGNIICKLEAMALGINCINVDLMLVCRFSTVLRDLMSDFEAIFQFMH
jgi:predicted transcriptional regulator YheO